MSEAFAFVQQEREFEHHMRTGKRPPPRDVVCFDYKGNFKGFKRALKTFLKERGDEFQARSFGGWQYTEYWRLSGSPLETDWQRAKLLGKHRGLYRLEMKIGGVAAEALFEDLDGTVGFFYERQVDNRE